MKHQTIRKAEDVLEDALRSAYWHGELGNKNGVLAKVRNEAQAALYKDLMELIGEDEVPYTDLASETDALRRNNLRSELRTKVKAYFGVEE